MRNELSRIVRPVICAGLLLSYIPSVPAQYTNGIYAEFNTSMGNYTCRLEYVLAPKTCANFIALADGQRSWLDLPTGLVRTNPFYNGTTFHRVIAGFMNQGGSKNALGTDGPGYQFVDEFNASLRHDGFGVLSMANSGPDSNGSQYFITVSPQPSLNDVHSVFGKLYGGSNVVYAINHVATGDKDKPLTNVTVNSIDIRRIGAAAIGFDINTNGLPVVTNLNLKIARSGANVSLTFSNQLNTDNRLFSSSTLTSWTHSQLGVETALPVTNTIYRAANASRQFFKMAQVCYPSNLFPPRNIHGRTLTVVFTNGGSGTLIINPNSTGGGTYTFNGSPGAVLFYSWAQDPYNGKLLPIGFTGTLDLDMTLSLNFDTASTGGMTGKVYPAPFYYPNHPFPSSVAGSFTISP